jgi:integrase
MKIKRQYRKDLQAWRWGFDITISGQRIRRYEWRKKKDAVDAVAALFERNRAERYGMASPEPAITLKDLEAKLTKDKSLTQRKPMLRVFNEFLEAVEHETVLNKLTRADWKKFLDHIADRKLQPGTINQYLSRVSSALHRAGDYFPELGEWRPPTAPWLPDPPGRERLLSNQEVSKLLAALRADRQKGEKMASMDHRHEIFDLFRLMLLTAAREGEILNLTQSQVSWDWKTVRIETKKGGGSVRVVPLSEMALEMLKSRQVHAPRFFKQIPKNGFYRALQKAGEMAKVEYGERIKDGWILYDVRHLASTVMESSGIPYSAVSAILGHKRRDQTATYTHVRLETMRQGVEILEKHCREIDGFFFATGHEMPPTASVRQQA